MPPPFSRVYTGQQRPPDLWLIMRICLETTGSIQTVRKVVKMYREYVPPLLNRFTRECLSMRDALFERHHRHAVRIGI